MAQDLERGSAKCLTCKISWKGLVMEEKHVKELKRVLLDLQGFDEHEINAWFSS